MVHLIRSNELDATVGHDAMGEVYAICRSLTAPLGVHDCPDSDPVSYLALYYSHWTQINVSGGTPRQCMSPRDFLTRYVSLWKDRGNIKERGTAYMKEVGIEHMRDYHKKTLEDLLAELDSETVG